eukprot:2143129-Amphidinium_carterae.1
MAEAWNDVHVSRLTIPPMDFNQPPCPAFYDARMPCTVAAGSAGRQSPLSLTLLRRLQLRQGL